MRALLLSFSALLAACTCAPPAPVAVTFRVKNSSADPIYLDDTDGKLGLSIRRGADPAPLGEQRCECAACESICASFACVCPDPAPNTVRKLEPNGSSERSFSGAAFLDFLVSCEGTRLQCKQAENLPVNETLSLRLCFVSERPSGVTDPVDGGSVPGRLPEVGQTCVDKEFRIADGVVEIGPQRGTTCADTGLCAGAGELCLGGSCTTSCPANGFPELGANWSLRLPSVDDQGFFDRTTVGSNTVLTGTGTLTSVLYQGQTTKLELARAGNGAETLRGTVFISLPPGFAAPFPQGETVTVKVVDASKDRPDNRALTVRSSSGALLFAADVAQPGPLLSAAELSPFTVERAPQLIGCRVDTCGKLLYQQTRFAAGADSVSLDPGASVEKLAGGGLYQFLNVSNGRYPKTQCTFGDLAPWALWKK